ncbi:MAG: ABC transporter permease [Blautia sp.]|nr:ABC transporter permease [Blautia sp.]
MSELQVSQVKTKKVRHRDRVTQVPIYFGKLLRSFIYQNDWKLLPMCAVIAALVSMVVRNDFFVSMEGTLKGSFALTCVAIWNGCFNSIQSICRERNIVKREHRSGMHITAYVCAHMMYQALLCMAQSILTLVVCQKMGVIFPAKGLITGYFMVDMTITLFLISYGADMISLFVSSFAHTTTGAMTIMPFLLIFQLVFSGGIFNLPPWTARLADFTISNYGLKCVNAQADFNSKPLVTAWNSIAKLKSNEIDEVITLDQILTILENEENPSIAELRAAKIVDLLKAIDVSVPEQTEVNDVVGKGAAASSAVALSDYLSFRVDSDGKIIRMEDVTVGDIVDLIGSGDRNTSIHIQTTVGKIIDLFGEQQIKELVETETASASRVDAYEHSSDNIIRYWLALLRFIIIFAVLTVISLEFIDKDKR